MSASVVVSMTTIPSRVGLIDGVIEALLDQTHRDIDFRLYIPVACDRTGRGYDVPDRLAARAMEDARFRIRRIATDYGPATKLLAAYEELSSRDCSLTACVITVDDDILLESHAIEELAEASSRYPGEALGFMGVSGDEFVHAEQLSANGLRHATPSVLGGYRSVLYPLQILDDSLFEDYAGVRARCRTFLDDDHLFAWNLARRGITRRVLATRHPGPEHGLNIRFLNLPDAVSKGPDRGAAVMRSHRCLVEYYRCRGWSFPL
jgi:hypothetical protein